MRFFASASAVLAFASSALAQTPDFNPVFKPAKGEEVAAGATFEITWEAPAKYQDGTVSISLIGGADPNTLVPIGEVAAGIANSDESYQWAVDATLGADATYGLVFKLDSDPSVFQYSNPFHIKKGTDGGKPTHTVTTATGIKTVTLTSCPPTETTTPPVISSTFAPNTTSTWSTTQHWNTTSAVYTTALPPTTAPIVTPEPSAPGTPVPEVPSAVPTAAGAHLVAGPVALIGGLAVAFLAL